MRRYVARWAQRAGVIDLGGNGVWARGRTRLFTKLDIKRKKTKRKKREKRT